MEIICQVMEEMPLKKLKAQEITLLIIPETLCMEILIQMQLVPRESYQIVEMRDQPKLTSIKFLKRLMKVLEKQRSFVQLGKLFN